MVIKIKEGGYLDTFKGIKYPFNYSIGDVRDITKRNIDFSKTIKLPATKNNNTFFEMFFNVNVQSGSFNANERRYIYVESNGEQVFSGYIQLLGVVINGDNMYYESVVFSDFRNILDVVQGLDLNDLDFSEYNHPWTAEVFRKSIESQRENYVYYDEYLKADKTPIFTKMPELGKGYVYPYISHDGNLFDWNYLNISNNALNLINASPSFFVREYMEKIFLLAGYKTESKFFDTEYFKSLILPFTNGEMELTKEEAEEYRVEYRGDSVDFIDTDNNGGVNYLPLLPDTKIIDANNIYDVNNYKLTVNKNGNKNIRFYGKLKIIYDIPEGKTIYRENNGGSFRSSFRIAQWADYTGTNDSADIARYSETMYQLEEQPSDINDLIDGTFTFSYDTTLSDVRSDIGWDLQFIAYIKNTLYYYKENGVRVYLSSDYVFEDFGFDYKLSDDASVIVSGDKLNVTKALPKFKITDFLKSIITMFNLYIYPKEGDSNTLIIESRDEFYNQGRKLFMDDALDKSKTITVKTLSEESAKTYQYKFKDSKDYVVSEYKDSNDGKTYAEKTIETENNFLTKKQSYSLQFASTANRDVLVTGAEEGDFKNVPVLFSREVDSELSTDLETVYSYKKESSPPRMLFYSEGGFASHKSSLDYPEFTLDFEFMKEKETDDWNVYYDLYNLFHKNTVDEVSSPDAKLMTCYLYFDKSKTFLQDKLYIMGDLWRINKIIDYDANNHSSTKVELFKISGKINYLTAESIIKDIENKDRQFTQEYTENYS